MMPYKQIIIAVLLVHLGACSSTSVAPVDSRTTANAYKPAPVNNYDPEPVTKGFHEVVEGDTLYSISWRYGLDYRDVARWNNISGAYVIYPGQKIQLIPGPGNAPEPAVTRSVQPDKSTPSATPSPRPQSQPVRPRAQPVISQKNISWRWPAMGRLIRSNTPIARKGLNIAGNAGQTIEAAADGVVVYSGSGLLGYGKLIIIKHNETYLSAYAHNQVMQVKEGDRVNAGQKISTMGRDGKGQPLLHFEIRREGKPVDPLQYLPARS